MLHHSLLWPLLGLASIALGSPTGYGGNSIRSPVRQVSSPSVHCRTEYVTLWDTTYQEKEEQVCTTQYEKQCETQYQRQCRPTTREECHTEQDQKCDTVYKNVCVDQYSTEYEPYTETECTTQYKEDCQYQWEGEGNDKVWVPIPNTCNNVPYDECKDVTKTHAKQVARQVCNDVPEEKCVLVPRQVCVTLPDQVCSNQPLTQCQDVPTQKCHSEHKKFPVRVSRQQAKKVCDEGYTDSVPAQRTPSVSLSTKPAITSTLGDILGTRKAQTDKLQTDKDAIVFKDN